MSRRSGNFPKIASAVSFLLAVSATVQPALAQEHRRWTPEQVEAERQRIKAANRAIDGNTTKLQQAPQLPDIPDYTGQKKFVIASVTDGSTCRTTRVIMNAKEAQDRIMEWYQNVLRSNQWNIKVAVADSVTAVKQDKTVNVQAQNLTQRDYRTAIHISLTELKPQQR